MTATSPAVALAPSGSDRKVVAVPGLGAILDIRQHRSAAFRELTIDGPSLIWVRQGRKSVASGDLMVTASEGEAVAIDAGTRCLVTNEIGRGSLYLADALSFDAALAATYAPVAAGSGHRCMTAFRPDDGFREAFERLRLSFTDDAVPMPVRRHMLAELLVRLSAAGLAFGHPDDRDPVNRIRRLVGMDLSGTWPAADVAGRLGMSEQTLRRRLAAQGTCLTDVIADLRMSAALTLLQATDRPVTAIAFDVGYASPSRFAARFKARFGLSPSDIRHGEPRPDQIGTSFERSRAAAPSAPT